MEFTQEGGESRRSRRSVTRKELGHSWTDRTAGAWDRGTVETTTKTALLQPNRDGEATLIKKQFANLHEPKSREGGVAPLGPSGGVQSWVSFHFKKDTIKKKRNRKKGKMGSVHHRLNKPTERIKESIEGFTSWKGCLCEKGKRRWAGKDSRTGGKESGNHTVGRGANKKSRRHSSSQGAKSGGGVERRGGLVVCRDIKWAALVVKV